VKGDADGHDFLVDHHAVGVVRRSVGQLDLRRTRAEEDHRSGHYLSESVGISSIWSRIEVPTLKANPNVTSITSIDPERGRHNFYG
jgi:hypothetical protein